MRLSKLTQELALALEVASIQQAWGNPSPFQDKINELLVKAGRKPVAPNKACSRRVQGCGAKVVKSKTKVMVGRTRR
jgi:hypothetical protein